MVYPKAVSIMLYLRLCHLLNPDYTYTYCRGSNATLRLQSTGVRDTNSTGRAKAIKALAKQIIGLAYFSDQLMRINSVILCERKMQKLEGQL